MNKPAAPRLPWWHCHRHLYNWVIHFADTRHGPRALFLLSFAESSFFPVPPDVLLAPLTLGAPRKWFRFALACSIASVMGGMFGYFIGFFLWSATSNFFFTHVPGFSRDKIVLTNGQEIAGVIVPEHVESHITFPFKITTNIRYPAAIYDTQRVRYDNIQLTDVRQAQVGTFSMVGSLYRAHDWKIVAIAGFTPLPYKVITITAGVVPLNFLSFCIASALSRSARFFLVAGLFAWKGEKMRPVIEKYFNWLSLLFVLLLIGGFAAIKLLHN